MKKICAIYTRKSTEERLDMEFNSLDAQRESCEAYIASQRAQGWIRSPEEYNDGGFSGGSLERPALARLLDDIRAGRVHIIVVYKIDRLTRSLMDFAKLVEVFDEQGVTFVSVTQSFNTTTSMGRLTLNVLLSFAQFEREVAGERIRDKIAASKARGMWMGGTPPVGYSTKDRQLIVNEKEVSLARLIFERYAELGSVRNLKRELDTKGVKSPMRTSLKGKSYGGCAFSRGALYAILRNPAYIGKIRHKDKIHDGLHPGIIDEALWRRAQEIMNSNIMERTGATLRRHMLQGLLFDPDGIPYSPTFTARHDRQYCYYITRNIPEDRAHPKGLIARLPAHEIEQLLERSIRQHLPLLWPGEEQDVVRTHLLENHTAISGYDLVRGLVERVMVDTGSLAITFKSGGLEKLAAKHLEIAIPAEKLDVSPLTVSYKTAKAKRGAVVIEPEGKQKDIFDLPPHKLKKLVQGVIWREEHFDGLALKDIAKREGCSEAYVGTAIMFGFDTLHNA